MSNQRRIGFIGSRDTDQFDPEWLALYTTAAARCAKNGCIIQTGAARGCDQLAAQAALEADGSINLVLPWESYEADWVSEMEDHYPDHVVVDVYDPDSHGAWMKSVQELHPAYSRLSLGAVALHARNYGIIYGTMCVVALPGIVRPGGTAQGMRIAEALKIPVYNLTTAKGRDDLFNRLNGAKKSTPPPSTARGPLGAEFIPTFPEVSLGILQQN